MNGEEPKFKDWKELVDQTHERIKLLNQQLDIQKAILTEAQSHIRKNN